MSGRLSRFQRTINQYTSGTEAELKVIEAVKGQEAAKLLLGFFRRGLFLSNGLKICIRGMGYTTNHITEELFLPFTRITEESLAFAAATHTEFMAHSVPEGDNFEVDEEDQDRQHPKRFSFGNYDLRDVACYQASLHEIIVIVKELLGKYLESEGYQRGTPFTANLRTRYITFLKIMIQDENPSDIFLHYFRNFVRNSVTQYIAISCKCLPPGPQVKHHIFVQETLMSVDPSRLFQEELIQLLRLSYLESLIPRRTRSA